MEEGDSTPAPEDPFRAAAEALEQRIEDWHEAALDDQYVAQTAVLERTTHDFIIAIRGAAFAFGRYPQSAEWLLPRFIDDFLESSIAIMVLARQGVFNVGRRELRYLLEAAVKQVYVDQQVRGESLLHERLSFLNDTSRVPRSSVNPINELTIRMLEEPALLKGAVHSAFGNLSGYTHLSKRQLDERLRRGERGEYGGFESAATLEAFNRLLVQTYDVILTLVFEGIGPAFTGDLFVTLFDDEVRWCFHRTRFVSRISHYFDYKVERQWRGDDLS